MIRSPAGFDGGDRIKRYLDYYQPSYGVMMLSAGEFSPASLFAAGEQGAWYDPSDFSTMFQDNLGATPVTAVEQTVGLILDKSGRGNNASQATPGARPTLSARVNLLTYTEDFSNVFWTKFNCTASAMNVADPIGGNTASTITAIAGPAYFYYDAGTSSPANGIVTTATIWARRRTGTGVVGLRNNAATGTYDTLTLTSSWQLYSVSCTAGAANQNRFVINIQTTGDAIDIWHPDLRVTNDGVGIPTYQRVGASTDYDTNGFPFYLKFDGSNDSFATASINFSATDKMSVFAGVRKLSDAAAGVWASLGNVASVAGSVEFRAPYSAAPNYGVSLRGDSGVGGWTLATYTAPVTNVIAYSLNLADTTGGGTNKLSAKVNAASVSATWDTGNAGTGNFANASLCLGLRNSSILPYNGRLYSLIVRGAQSTAAQIASTETWVNGKTKAY